jgi:hypothetical protein
MTDVGWITCKITTYNDGSVEVDDIEYDDSTCVFWIEVGVSIEYWIKEYCDIKQSGKYRISGITGDAYRCSWEYEYEKIERID